MFCSKCGNELKNGEQFCPKCGTKSGTTGKPINLNISTEDMKNKAIEMKSNLISGVVDLGKNKVLVLGNIALLILSLIFSFTNTFKVDAILGVSEGMSLVEDVGMKPIYLILYLTAIIVLMIPLLFKKAWSPKFFLPAKIVTILSSLYFLIVLFIGLDEVDSSGYGSIAEFNLSVTGWLFVITTIGALVLAYKNTFDLKKLKESSKAIDQNALQTDGKQTNQE